MSVPLRSKSTVEPVRVLPLRGAQTFPQEPSKRRSSRTGLKAKRAKRPVAKLVQALPKARRPLWLRGLMGLQALSSGLALGTVGVTLVMYGLTVQADRRLNAATLTLRQLQQQEQQLTSAKAVLQHHLNQDVIDLQTEFAEQNVVFLEPAIAHNTSEGGSKPSSDPQPALTSPQPFPSAPMGY